MGSLGGLDVAFGAQLQIVRTNVLFVETNPAAATIAHAQTVHEIANAKWVSSMRPDFTCFAENDYSTGYLVEPTDIVEGGILNSTTVVPLAGSQRDSTAANNRGLAVEAILNVGAVEIQANDTATVDDLFRDAGGSTSGEEVGTGETSHAATMQSALMKASFDAGAVATTISLQAVLDDSEFGDGTAVTGADLDNLSSTSTAAALNDQIGDAATLVSVVALGRVL